MFFSKKNRLYQFLCSLWIKNAQRSDKTLGVDFSVWEDNQRIGIPKHRGNHYQPSTNDLEKVLDKLPITEKDTIIDIGCGKGKALYMMSQFPFRQIDGLELSDALCHTAERNIKKLNLSRCRIINHDAATFSNYDDYNYFYIFNSFPEAVFLKMLDRILSSIERSPRKITLIYLNPVCHHHLINHGFRLFYRKNRYTKWFSYHCYHYS
ncbi:class I SAM-dependent methyltransferase [Eubacterium sp.]|uniref:class I SAM-dependent methyltransferase n=1 Tax=Eubacterium sp. TaxID=142586 RepID=UPI002FC829E9